MKGHKLSLSRPQTCDLCGPSKFETVINMEGKVMVSDRKIIQGRLKKIQCCKCGLVSSEIFPDSKKIEENYKINYSYNIGQNGDTFFFTPSGAQDRSSHVFEWISNIVPRKEMARIKTIVEVGCCEGNLLAKFYYHFPDKKIIGLELNENAIKIGRKRDFDIRRLDESHGIKADLVISYAVIEHTLSPKKFLKSLCDLLNPTGLIITGQPHQDKPYYDVFFVDHLHHFSTKHIQDLARQTNLVQIKKSIGAWPIDSFSLHLFKLSNRKLISRIVYRKTQTRTSVRYYKKVFQKINLLLTKTKYNRLAVFGLGEVFSLFYTYSELSRFGIKYGIDDFPKNKYEFPFPVISSLETSKYDIDAILFCINPKYYKIVLKKFYKRKYKILLPFDKKFNP